MDPLTRLALAAIVFFAIHAFVAGTALRRVLVKALSEKGYLGLFSLASLTSLVALWLAYRAAPCAPLWNLPRVFGWLPLAVMPVALFLMAGAFSTPNPTAVGGERVLAQAEPARGALRITRHPFLWGVMLWSSVHLLVLGSTSALWFFGGLLVTAALGTRSIDRKRALSQGEAWRRFVAVTSNLPLAAVARRRNHVEATELQRPALIAVALTVFLLVVHRALFGVSPVP